MIKVVEGSGDKGHETVTYAGRKCILFEEEGKEIAKKIVAVLDKAGHECEVSPFSPTKNCVFEDDEDANITITVDGKDDDSVVSIFAYAMPDDFDSERPEIDIAWTEDYSKEVLDQIAKLAKESDWGFNEAI